MFGGMTSITPAKVRDIASATPLLVWLLLGVAASLMDARELFEKSGELVAAAAALVGAGFFGLLIFLVAARLPAIGRACGWAARLCALAALAPPFLFLLVARSELSPLRLAFSNGLILLGTAGAIYCACWLGRSFGVLPRARALVTGGPYSRLRHPLYACEILLMAGVMLRYEQPLAGLVFAACAAAQIPRMHFEERAMEESFPDYADYARRTRRLLPFIY